jgi:hypothetical protein
VQQKQQQEQQSEQLLEFCPSQARGTTVALSKMPPHWKTKNTRPSQPHQPQQQQQHSLRSSAICSLRPMKANYHHYGIVVVVVVVVQYLATGNIAFE